MIFAEFNNKKFWLNCNNGKIKSTQLSWNEKKYIKNCVKEILSNYDKNKEHKTEFIAKNLLKYGINTIRKKIFISQTELNPFLEYFKNKLIIIVSVLILISTLAFASNVNFKTQVPNTKTTVVSLQVTDINIAQKYYNQGLENFNDGNYKEALDNFNNAISHGLSNEDIYLKIASVKTLLNDYDGAIKDCEKILAINPNSRAKELYSLIKDAKNELKNPKKISLPKKQKSNKGLYIFALIMLYFIFIKSNLPNRV